MGSKGGQSCKNMGTRKVVTDHGSSAWWLVDWWISRKNILNQSIAGAPVDSHHFSCTQYFMGLAFLCSNIYLPWFSPSFVWRTLYCTTHVDTMRKSGVSPRIPSATKLLITPRYSWDSQDLHFRSHFSCTFCHTYNSTVKSCLLSYYWRTQSFWHKCYVEVSVLFSCWVYAIVFE